MALDGIMIKALKKELCQTLTDARIHKIAQPQPDELFISFKTKDSIKKLILCANASLPYVCLTEENKTSPLTAPNFCMFLRKHIGGGKLVDITQPSLERILCFHIQHYNELGDPCQFQLYVEIMGKHSNIILCDENDTILNAIKHIPASLSSVREVLPQRKYFIPNTMDKKDPLSYAKDVSNASAFAADILEIAKPLYIALSDAFTGFGRDVGQELCHRAEVDADRPANTCTIEEQLRLFTVFTAFVQEIRKEQFCPHIVYDHDKPVSFGAFYETRYSNLTVSTDLTPSEVLLLYYQKRAHYTRMHEQNADLRKIVQTSLERAVRKYDLQLNQMKDTEKRENYRIYGEILTAYGYEVAPGAAKATLTNYYTDEPLTIPLDPTLSAIDNAKRYFDKYAKCKRTYEALTEQMKETSSEIEYLQSVQTSIELATSPKDLSEIKKELTQSGYIRLRSTEKKGKARNEKSEPLQFVSSDGFTIYVGKNNYQNDYLTFQLASAQDWWFHAKKMPGSHVIVKTEGKEMTDRTFEEAASLAAYFSKGQADQKVDIDYLKRKDVKKPNGAKPGFVIYYTNYSMTASPADAMPLLKQVSHI